tara:strand:- start:326 stop:499 length:174 start_codon:yes stop_codon:yes gene_type:complete
MTVKKDLYVYMLKNGTKRPKKVKLRKLIDNINLEVWTKKFFINESDVKKYIDKMYKK